MEVPNEQSNVDSSSPLILTPSISNQQQHYNIPQTILSSSSVPYSSHSSSSAAPHPRYRSPPPSPQSSPSPIPLTEPITTRHWLLSKEYLPFYLLASLILLGGILFLIYHTAILEWSITIADKIKSLGTLGLMLSILLLFSLSFPPLFGYGTALYACGFIYGCPLGMIPAYFGPLMGSMTCFYLSRKYISNWKEMITARWEKWNLVEKAILSKGLGVVILIRIAPYPFALFNCLLSFTPLPFSRFVLATSIALTKNIVHVYLGSTVHDLAAINNERTPAQIAALVISSLVAIGVFIYVGLLIKKTLDEEEYTEEVVQEDIRLQRNIQGDIRVDQETRRTDMDRTESETIGNGYITTNTNDVEYINEYQQNGGTNFQEISDEDTITFEPIIIPR